MKRIVLASLALICAVSAQAASTTTATTPVSTTTTTVIDNKSKIPPVAQLLSQGYEIKAGFFDASGIAYMAMQKGTSAYLCHAGTTPACDKLN